MDGLSNNQNQSTSGVGFPQNDPTNSVPAVSNTQTVSSKFPGDMPSADVPIPQNVTPTLVPPTNDSGNKGNGKMSFGKSGRKALATILGLVLLVAGVGTGVYLVGQQQDVSTRAYNCSRYVFEVKQDGEVIVTNGTVNDQPRQGTRVYINGTMVSSDIVAPKIDSGTSLSIGRVTVPDSGVFEWRVDGKVDCSTRGEYVSEGTGSIQPYCSQVVTYDTQWSHIPPSELSNLKAGDTVRFAVIGKTGEGTFEAAKFTINGIEQPETTLNRTEEFETYKAYEFYMDYAIPNGVDDFTVSAKVKHSSIGWF